MRARQSARGGDAEVEEIDDFPTSRVARARELGVLGVSLFSTLARAGARGLFSGAGERERIWSGAHGAGASILLSGLGRLRGAAAKIGQILGQHPGSLPDEYVEAMLTLTDGVPPMSYGLVRTQFVHEFGKVPQELFASFDRQPFASGSFGQVHRATLLDGSPAAVKVQYPGIDETLESDLANLALLVPAMERVVSRSDLREALAETRERLTEELDYRLEAEHYALFRHTFADEPFVIPAVHEALSTERILTLDFVEGESLHDYLAGEPSLEERNGFALGLLRFTFTSVLKRGMAHVDPNPGNYLFRADGKLGVVDFGCVKRFPPSFPGELRSLLRAAARGDDRTIDDALEACGMIALDTRPEHRAPVRELMRLWARPGLTPDFDFGDRSYLDELMAVQRRLLTEGAVTIPPDLLFYGRQVIGLSYLLYKLGARHPTAFVEHYAGNTGG